MFRRIIVEDWERTLSLLGWALCGLVFLVTTVRALRMPRESVQRLENLPLENETHE